MSPRILKRNDYCPCVGTPDLELGVQQCPMAVQRGEATHTLCQRPNAPYDDGWFYADGEKPVGPVTTDDSNAVLRAKSDPSKVRVWRADFPDWRETKDVLNSLIRLRDHPRLPQPPPFELAAHPEAYGTSRIGTPGHHRCNYRRCKSLEPIKLYQQ